MDELISRQAAIDAMAELQGRASTKAELKGISKAWKRIKQLPPIQPKRGRWVLVCDNNGMHFICNKCGAWRYHQEQKFCGECGSDMREVNHESN